MARIVKSVGTFLNSVFRGKEESSSIDAVYVHPRLIVVGEPQKRVLAETKGRQRSNISEELSNFLVHRHGHNFMLWNLSLSEDRHVGYRLFDQQVLEFPPYKHENLKDLPSITQVYSFIYTVEFWLEWDPEHVAVVFGGDDDILRTAFFVSCYLAYVKRVHNNDDRNAVQKELQDFLRLMRIDGRSIRPSQNWKFLLEEMNFLFDLPTGRPERRFLSVLILQLPGRLANCKECPEVEIFSDGCGSQQGFVSREHCIPGKTIKWMSESLRVEVNKVFEGDVQIVVYSHARVPGEKQYEQYLEYEESVGEQFDELYQSAGSLHDDEDLPSHPHRPAGIKRRAILRFSFHTSDLKHNAAMNIQQDKMDVLEPKLVDSRGVALYITLQDPPKVTSSPPIDSFEINLKGLDALDQGFRQLTYHHPVSPTPQLFKKLLAEGFEQMAIACALKCTENHLRASRRILATGLLFKVGAISHLRTSAAAQKASEEEDMSAEEIYAARTLCLQRSAGVMLPAPTDEEGCQEVIARREVQEQGTLARLGSVFFGDSSEEETSTPQNVSQARTRKRIDEGKESDRLGFDFGYLLRAIDESEDAAKEMKKRQSVRGIQSMQEQNVDYANFLSDMVQWGEETHAPYSDSLPTTSVNDTRKRADEWLSLSRSVLTESGRSDRESNGAAERKKLADLSPEMGALSAFIEDLSSTAIEHPQKFHAIMDTLYGNEESKIEGIQRVMVGIQNQKYSQGQQSDIQSPTDGQCSATVRTSTLGTPLLSPSSRAKYLRDTTAGSGKDNQADGLSSSFGPSRARREVDEVDQEQKKLTSAKRSLGRKQVDSVRASDNCQQESTGNAAVDPTSHSAQVFAGEYESDSEDDDQSHTDDEDSKNVQREADITSEELMSPEGDPRVSLLVNLYRRSSERKARGAASPAFDDSTARNLGKDYSYDEANRNVEKVATKPMEEDRRTYSIETGFRGNDATSKKGRKVTSDLSENKVQNSLATVTRGGNTAAEDSSLSAGIDEGDQGSSVTTHFGSDQARAGCGSMASATLRGTNTMASNRSEQYLQSEASQSEESAGCVEKVEDALKPSAGARSNGKALQGNTTRQQNEPHKDAISSTGVDASKQDADASIGENSGLLSARSDFSNQHSKFSGSMDDSSHLSEGKGNAMASVGEGSGNFSLGGGPLQQALKNKFSLQQSVAADSGDDHSQASGAPEAKKEPPATSVQSALLQNLKHNLESPEDLHKKFSNMLSVGVPRETVKLKAEQAGLEFSSIEQYTDKNEAKLRPNEQSAESDSETAQATLKGATTQQELNTATGPPLCEDERYSKFFKMLKAGVPRPAVEQKMCAENVDTLILDLDPEKPLPSEQSSATQKESGPPLKDEPHYAKFFKMLKVGAPLDGVKIKAEAEGLNPAALDLDPETPCPPEMLPSKSTEAEKQSKKKIKPKRNKKEQPLEKRKKIFWDAIPLDQIETRRPVQRSIWGSKCPESRQSRTVSHISEGSDDGVSSPEKCDEREHEVFPNSKEYNTLLTEVAQQASSILDESEFRSLFVKDQKQLEAESERKKKAKQKDNAKKQEKVSLIDGKRAMNVGIALSRLKLPSAVIYDSLSQLSLAPIVEYRESIYTEREEISYNDLTLLPELIPTADEISTVKSYLGEKERLGDVEKFFLVIADIPEAWERAKALLVQMNFNDRVQEIHEQLDVFLEACKEVRNSRRLRRILKIALLVGNKMNGIDDPTNATQARKATYAFTVDSLLKFSHTKAFDGKTTVLSFLCRLLQRHYSSALRIDNDFKSAAQVVKLSIDSVQQDIDVLGSDVALMDRLVREQVRSLGSWDKVGMLESGDSNPLKMPMAQYVSKANEKMNETNNKLSKTLERFSRLKEYWGENADMPPDEFFGTINSFVQAILNTRDTLGIIPEEASGAHNTAASDA